MKTIEEARRIAGERRSRFPIDLNDDDGEIEGRIVLRFVATTLTRYGSAAYYRDK